MRRITFLVAMCALLLAGAKAQAGVRYCCTATEQVTYDELVWCDQAENASDAAWRAALEWHNEGIAFYAETLNDPVSGYNSCGPSPFFDTGDIEPDKYTRWRCRAKARLVGSTGNYQWLESASFWEDDEPFTHVLDAGIEQIEGGYLRDEPWPRKHYEVQAPKRHNTQCCELGADDDGEGDCEYTGHYDDPGLELNESEWWRCAANATPAPVGPTPVYSLRETYSFRSEKDNMAKALGYGKGFIEDGYHRAGYTPNKWAIRKPTSSNLECCALGSDMNGDCNWTISDWKYWMCNGDFLTGKNCGWKGVGKRVNSWTAKVAYVAACEDEYPEEGDLDYDTLTCDGHDVDPSGFPLDPDALDSWDPPLDVDPHADKTFYCEGRSDAAHGAAVLHWTGQRPTETQAEASAMKFWTLALKYPDPNYGALCAEIVQ